MIGISPVWDYSGSNIGVVSAGGGLLKTIFANSFLI